MPNVTPLTLLSELQYRARIAPATGCSVSPEMVRSIQQSMRVEGYPVSQQVIRSAASRVLNPRR